MSHDEPFAWKADPQVPGRITGYDVRFRLRFEGNDHVHRVRFATPPVPGDRGFVHSLPLSGVSADAQDSRGVVAAAHRDKARIRTDWPCSVAPGEASLTLHFGINASGLGFVEAELASGRFVAFPVSVYGTDHIDIGWGLQPHKPTLSRQDEGCSGGIVPG